MNHSCFNIPSGNLSFLPHTVFNLETVKEHLALDLEHNSVSNQLAGSGRNTFVLEENAAKRRSVEKGKFAFSVKILTRNPRC